MSLVHKSPRILYVTRIWPDKKAWGGDLRSRNVLRALQQIGSVEVVVLDDEARNWDQATRTMSEFKVADSLQVNRCANERFIEKLRWTTDPKKSYPNGCRVEPTEASRILRRLSEFDVVWFYTLRSPDLFPFAHWQRSVVDIDDVPSTFEQCALEVASDLRARLLARRRQFVWRRRERLLGSRFNILAVCSEGDKRYLGRLGIKTPIHVIPNGYDQPAVARVRSPKVPPRIGFIGNFGHLPNLEGIRWFTDKCWPAVKLAVPDARLRLVGTGSQGDLKPTGVDIDGLGFLDDPSEEISTWSVMVVPIRVGAGTRVKIAQAFSQKCPVVSSSLGAYGYDVEDGEELLVANSSQDFSRACIDTIAEPTKALHRAEMAWQKFLKKWTWSSIYPSVWAAAEECLSLNHRTEQGGPYSSLRLTDTQAPIPTPY